MRGLLMHLDRGPLMDGLGVLLAGGLVYFLKDAVKSMLWKRNGTERRNGRNGSDDPGCILAKGPMPDSALPAAALDFYSNGRAFYAESRDWQAKNLEIHERVAVAQESTAKILERVDRTSRTLYRLALAVTAKIEPGIVSAMPDEAKDL